MAASRAGLGVRVGISAGRGGLATVTGGDGIDADTIAASPRGERLPSGTTLAEHRRRWEEPMLDRSVIEEVLRAALLRGGSFAEIFAEERESATIHLDDGKIEELTSGLDRGAGVRVVHGEASAYAYSNRLDPEALLGAARAASASVRDAAGEAPDVLDL